MNKQELEDKIIDLQNLLIADYNLLDELWAYHPGNENFINPIKAYDEMKQKIDNTEQEIIDIKSKIERFNALN
jgi:D-serine dehydratase